MRIIIGALSVTMGLAFVPRPALAYCSEPSTSISFPDAPGSYDRPDVPSCLTSYAYSNEHTCDQWELSNYQNDVEVYIDKLKDYVDEAIAAANEAATLANDVQNYAKCEAEEVGSQHE